MLPTGCDSGDLVLVENATTAVNSVLRSQQLQPDDVVFHLNIEYGQWSTPEKVWESNYHNDITKFRGPLNTSNWDIIKHVMWLHIFA